MQRPARSGELERSERGAGDSPASTLLLSVDFEDWHQLVHRRVGASGWERPGPALPRQTAALLDLFEGLGLKATFFVLGMAARTYPDLVRDVAARGHEIGCHGDAHVHVHTQTPEDFDADLRAAKRTIEDLTGRVPVGYRAPAFSITRASHWAYEVLASEGFGYDASAHDSPALRDRPGAAKDTPHRLKLAGGETLWEFPVAVWHTRAGAIPIGGASYWSVLPRSLVLNGLEHAGSFAGLYLHPHELDPRPLRPRLGPGTEAKARLHAYARTVQRNGARRRAPAMLRAIAERFQLIPYGEAHAKLSGAGA